MVAVASGISLVAFRGDDVVAAIALSVIVAAVVLGVWVLWRVYVARRTDAATKAPKRPLDLPAGVYRVPPARTSPGTLLAIQRVRTALSLSMPVEQAVAVMAGGVHVRTQLGRRLDTLKSALDNGVPLPVAMRDAGVLTREQSARLEAGLRAGRADQTLAQIIDEIHRRIRWRQWSTTWMVYPAVVAVVLGLVLVFQHTRIVPKLVKIYSDFGLAPAGGAGWLGQAYFAFVLRYGFLFVLGAALAIGAGVLSWQTGMSLVPLVGAVARLNDRATVLRVLGDLIEAGCTAPEMLVHCRGAVRLGATSRRVGRALQHVSDGAELTDALRQARVLSASQTMALGAALKRRDGPVAARLLAQADEHRLERIAVVVRSFVVPMLIVVLGATVALTALGVVGMMAELTMRVGAW